MIDRLKLAAAVLIVIAGIAAFYYFSQESVLLRAGIMIVSVVAASGMALVSQPGQAAWEFAKGSRMEVRKVVWPTRRETVQVTLIVLLMVILVGIYIWLLDWAIFNVVYNVVLGN